MTVATQPMPHPARAAASDPLRDLRGRLLGPLITPDDPAYDEARRVLYFMIDRRPRAIVRVADADDVAEAVRFARQHALPLAVRSGGHSIALLSVIDDALLIDLSQMKRIRIEPQARIAQVQPGATSGDLGAAANPYGLALTTGDTHSVGFGGLTTGGGIGFMVRKDGLTIDNLLAAQVVTANGQIVTASAAEHPDLFWAIRGGGGNVGIVTEFTFRLAPVGQILGGELILPATREVLRGYLEYTASAPDDLTTIANLMYAPPFPTYRRNTSARSSSRSSSAGAATSRRGSKPWRRCGRWRHRSSTPWRRCRTRTSTSSRPIKPRHTAPRSA